jgi:ribosome-associated protein
MMPRPDGREVPEVNAGSSAVDSLAADGLPGDGPPSKTRRKAEMHALQEMGEVLVQLEPKRLALLAAEAALPERLVQAVEEARSITAWGGRKRQLKYVGRLLRDIDPEPVRRRLDLWAAGHDIHTARQHALEQWRDRLLAEPAALDALSAAYPQVDRPRFRALIAKAREERDRAEPPHAFRELFRELKALDAARAGAAG